MNKLPQIVWEAWDGGGGGHPRSSREIRLEELEELLEPVCGKCRRQKTIACPLTRTDWNRLVKVFAADNNPACDKWLVSSKY